jgi:hypothetical protein
MAQDHINTDLVKSQLTLDKLQNLRLLERDDLNLLGQEFGGH